MGSISITTTKRRRFFWCAWWTAEPCRDPFRKPDAFSGGARSLEEAKAEAERRAGRPLHTIDPVWARAFIRMQAGQTPWVEKKQRRAPHEEPAAKKPFTPSVAKPNTCPFAILGLPKTATPEEIRKAFRALALQTHPDQGGSAEAFIRVTWAQSEALKRRRS